MIEVGTIVVLRQDVEKDLIDLFGTKERVVSERTRLLTREVTPVVFLKGNEGSYLPAREKYFEVVQEIHIGGE